MVDNMKQRRESLGWSQQKLAELAGISLRQVGYMEKNCGQVRVKSIGEAVNRVLAAAERKHGRQA